jgi:hypothetical protein
MTKLPSIAAAALMGLTIAACSGSEAPDADEVTETQMDDVDVIDGTISDEMVDVDTIEEVDATGTEEGAKSDGKTESASEDEAAATDNSEE